MNIWVLLGISVLTIGVGWFIIAAKQTCVPLLVNLVIGLIALIYIIVVKKLAGWMFLPIIWFAGGIIPALLITLRMEKIWKEEKAGFDNNCYHNDSIKL
jgi:hypothetical protein